MAWYDEYGWNDANDGWDYEPVPDVNEILFGDPSTMDQHAQDLFREAFFEGNDAAYIDLVNYMWEEYHLDFEEAFDWEDFKEWYDSQ